MVVYQHLYQYFGPTDLITAVTLCLILVGGGGNRRTVCYHLGKNKMCTRAIACIFTEYLWKDTQETGEKCHF